MKNSEIDSIIDEIDAAKQSWAQSETSDRIAILRDVKDCLLSVSDAWVKKAAQQKKIPAGSPLKGEEWFSGPYALMTYCNAMITTLSGMQGKDFLKSIPLRELANGQIAARVVPHSIWDRLLLSGVRADVWMQKDVNMDNLAEATATAYDAPAARRQGKVALVLGAGNIAAIAPLDCLHKLFGEHQVVILKMNPVNEYLAEFFQIALKPLIERDALRIVKGGADLGKYLCNHAKIDEIHITGAGDSHDAIVWGQGAEGVKNKQAGTPVNRRRITSELGNVGPTIVVPGPWSKADLRFQAEHIATQKLHNSGFNCIACQMLILPDLWDKTQTLISNIESVMATLAPREIYYPGAADRMAEFASRSDKAQSFARGDAPACVVVPYEKGDDWFTNTEVFAPAMSTYRISESDPVAYLKAAIMFANQELHGSLGANIIIHPKTIKQIGKKKFEALIADLHYGCIGVNAWSGLGFLLNQVPWGAFPGHTLDDVQSGIGFVHNTFMFDKAERSVITAPFRPFPRNLLSGEFSLLPRPPWFVSNKKQHKIGKLLNELQHKPKWKTLPRIMLLALRG